MKEDPTRYTTCLKIGVETIDKGPYKGPPGKAISVNCYCWPEEPYIFNNVPISNKLNPLFDAKLTKRQSERKFGPPGVTTLAYSNQFYTVKLGRDSVCWGLLPAWVWYYPTKFCEWGVVPHLRWIGSNVHIPIPVMSFLRRASWHGALLIGAIQLVDLANEIVQRVGPYLEDGNDTPSTYKEFLEKKKARKHSLFFEYKDFHPGYKPLYFVYRPIAWALFAIDKYHLLPIWTRLSRIGPLEVKTIKKSKYHMGMKVLVGGTRIRYPGIIGAKEKMNVWLPFFVLDCTRAVLAAFATGNLYIFNWRV